MTALEKMGELPLTPDSLVPIMLKNAEGWDQVAVFVALTMHRKMEVAWEQQGRPIAATTQRPMPHLAIPPSFCHQQPSNGSRRRCRPVNFGDIRQPIYHLGLRSWSIPKWRESVVAPSTHLSSRGEMGAERLPAPKHSPLCHDAGPLWRSRASGCGVSGANLACVHRHTPRQTSTIASSITSAFRWNKPKFVINGRKCYKATTQCTVFNCRIWL